MCVSGLFWYFGGGLKKFFKIKSKSQKKYLTF